VSIGLIFAELNELNPGSPIHRLIKFFFQSKMAIEDHYPARGGILSRAQDIWLALWSSLVEFISTIKSKEYSINHKKYKVIKQLGEGGFSFVYLVKNPDGQLYALKKINCLLPEQIGFAKSEILAHSLVNSPNVIKLIDAEVSTAKNKAGAKLLLPYYKNGTIQDLISKNKGNIPIDVLLSYGIDICHGLLTFHSCKPAMAFRDLKPANILITDHHKAVLMDLGSVTEGRVPITSRKESIALQEFCAETVTAPFRAPELFDPPSSCVITVACDIWAFGCTLYAMAYGDSPCDGTLSSTLGGTVAFPKNDHYGDRFQALIKGILRVIHC
jgi:serine/threonine kinase 16